MQVGLQIGQLDQARQRAGGGGLELARILTQLGRNPRQADGGVDLFFGGARL